MVHSGPCVLFALGREALYFRRAFRRQRVRGAPCRGWRTGVSGRTMLVLETGMGETAVAAALDWVLGGPSLGGMTYRPEVIVSAGFSGALVPDLRVGDLVLADEVSDWAGNQWPATWPDPLSIGMGLPPWRRGRLLTTTSLVAVPEEKRRLGEQHRALAVDMETAAVARVCRHQGVPFGSLRVISDDGSTPLSPRLVGLLKHGRVAPTRVFAAVLAQPALVVELWRLARDTRRAARQMSLGLHKLLEPTRPVSGRV